MNYAEFLETISSKKVIIIAGEYGRGKSLVSTAILFMLFMYNGASKILSNVPLSYMIFNKLITIESYNSTSVLDKDHKKTLIHHDELQRDFNTREFQSSSSNIFSKFAVNFRKDESQLIGTIQFIDRLDNALNEIVQLIIIPTYRNHYSKNDKVELAERLLRKDFIIDLKLKDTLAGENYQVEPINFYPYLFFYDTKFKPLPLVINHEEYLDKQAKNLSEAKYEALRETIKRRQTQNIENWNNGLIELLIKQRKFYEISK